MNIKNSPGLFSITLMTMLCLGAAACVVSPDTMETTASAEQPVSEALPRSQEPGGGSPDAGYHSRGAQNLQDMVDPDFSTSKIPPDNAHGLPIEDRAP